MNENVVYGPGETDWTKIYFGTPKLKIMYDKKELAHVLSEMLKALNGLPENSKLKMASDEIFSVPEKDARVTYGKLFYMLNSEL